MKQFGIGIGLVALLTLASSAVLPLVAQAAARDGARVLASDARHLVLEFETPPLQIASVTRDGVAYSAVSIPGWADAQTPGAPQLPALGQLVAVPQQARVTLNVLQDETALVALDAPPLPAPQYDAPPPQIDAAALNDFAAQLALAQPPRARASYQPAAAMYQDGETFPAQFIEISAPARWRSQRYLAVRFYPAQYLAAAGQLRVHQRVRVELQFDMPADARAEAFGARVDEGPFEKIFQASLLNYAAAQTWRARVPEVSLPARPDASAAARYKIAVNADGIYRLTCAMLQDAGINPDALPLDSVRLLQRDDELAIEVQDHNQNNRCDGDDAIHFWGVRANTAYTDTNIYWLTYGGGAGKRMTTRSVAGGAPATQFAETATLDENNFFIGKLPMIEDADHWYWLSLPNQRDPDGNGDPVSADFDLTLDSPILAGDVTLRVALGGISYTTHHTQIFVNDTLVADETWDGIRTRDVETVFPASVLRAGANVLRVAEINPAPNYIWVNRFVLDYARAFTARDDALGFRQTEAGAWDYTLTGFTQPQANVFDVTDAFNVTQLAATTEPSGNGYAARFGDDAAAPRAYYAVAPVQYRAPLSVAADAPSDLRSASNGADYILITHAAFKTQAQALAEYRAAQMRVITVDVQDIYDEFNGGVFDPQAIRDFLAYAYANWQPPKPSYALLVGNGNLNPKNYPNYAVEPNYIPAYMKLADPYIGMVASDNRLVTLDENSPLPSIAIGRLPVLNADEADAVIQKILQYEKNPPPGAWRAQATFVADNAYEANGAADGAGNFWALSDGLINNPTYVPTSLSAERIYYNPCVDTARYPWCALPYSTFATPGAAHTALLDAMNAGRLLVNYIGHSGIDYWSGNLWKSGDAAALNNGGKLPLLLPMTCYDGYFQMPGMASISEALVARGNGGALASWAPTGQGVASGHDVLDRGFFEAVMQRGATRLGSAILLAKADLAALGTDQDLLDTYNLLGDPASKLALPEVTSFAAFSARQKNNWVALKWRTASEENLIGFRVWRQVGKKKWKLYTPELIAAKRAGSAEGAKYTLKDQKVNAGKTYRYKVEVLKTNGASEWSEVKTVQMQK